MDTLVSTDGKTLAVWARLTLQTPGEKKQKDAKADAEWVNHDQHSTRLYLAAFKANGPGDRRNQEDIWSMHPTFRGASWSPVDNRDPRHDRAAQRALRRPRPRQRG